MRQREFSGFGPGYAFAGRRESPGLTARLDEAADALRGHLLSLYRSGELDLEDEQEVFRAAVGWLQGRYPDLSYQECAGVARSVLKDMQGYGPIHSLMTDPEVSDIIIHSHDDITYEKLGQKYAHGERFRSAAHLRLFVEKLAHLGRARVDESRPYGTFTLPEGHRVAVAVPPCSGFSPHVAIRKFVRVPTLEELVEQGFFSPEAAEFFRLAVKGRRNILFTGGMGTGKTTMIAVAGRLFGDDDHVVLVEEVMECPLSCRHLRRLVARPPSVEGTGEITLATLLKLALMMKPTRILVSEVRDGAIFIMLQAMLVGHEGSMSTIHADSAQKALFERVPLMLSMSKEAAAFTPQEKLRFAASALHLIFHLEQDPFTGKRYCKEIAEVLDDPPGVRLLFAREDGTLRPTGEYPERAALGAVRYGVTFPRELFERR
ncbi:type II secretion system protein E [Ammonifex degensii KC4]|uniref:Type II secretion system protein E n=1 Tax=Ammonifex degensii (strain DSM 10501 / KC4) TaxID=429009 RepID=C9RCE6_AMMDK|nr:ATPase, T2SS/T4P/T4SS family [Ammonifex degensii]ACX51923.1 type II secretion system protein E [Ammonifex degensii KC4]